MYAECKIHQHADKPLRLFVWNADFDVLRQVIIVPNRNWGDGKSLLGCGIGFGLLHRIPKPQDRRFFHLQSDQAWWRKLNIGPAVFEENDLPEDQDLDTPVDDYVTSEGVSVVAVGENDEPISLGLRPQTKSATRIASSPSRRVSTPLSPAIEKPEE